MSADTHPPDQRPDSTDDFVEREPYAGDVEAEDTTGDPITEPFDPMQIRFELWQPTIDLLMRRISEGAIKLDPDFQRRADIWTPKAKSQLIESFLMRIPIPAFYIDGTNEQEYVVVDGLQRLTALRQFIIDGELALSDLEFLTQYNGHHFVDLPRHLQRRIEETQVTVFRIQAGTPDAAKYNVFRRVNTGGVPLTPQEIRHALNQGPATALLKELAHSEEFVSATGGAVKGIRLADQECVLRFLAFVLTPYTDYDGPDLERFLNDAMGRLNDLDGTTRNGLRVRFFRAMMAAQDLLARDAFRKLDIHGDRRFPFNKALFEAWSVNLDARTDEDIVLLVERRDEVLERFRRLMDDYAFVGSVSGGTGKEAQVRTRFGRIEALLREVVPC